MPAKEQIVRVRDLETYRLEEWLGDGAIATVWSGVGVEGTDDKVAVKIAHPALSPTLRKQFYTEYDTLTNLLDKTRTWPSKEGEPPVPAFIRQAKLEPEGQDALVTELIQTDTLSKLVLDEDDLKRRQELLVEPAYQYAWFLNFLHNRVGISQSDRKLGDLYWDAEQQRLIVLDWNVVEDGIARASEDVYKFGEMWYALLLGVTPTLGSDITSIQEWEQLNAAWRTVLEECLRPNRQARPKAEKLLKEMLGRMRNIYLLQSQELLLQGKEALQQAKDQKDFEQAERAWWLLDMAQQKGLADAGEPAQAAEAMCKQRGQEHLRDVKEGLEYGRNDAAESALEKAQGETGDDPDDRLRLARWRCLVNAAKKGREEKISAQFREVASRLTAAVAALEAGQWPKAKEELKSALDDLPGNGETRVILDDLDRDLNLHLVLAEAVGLRGNAKFVDAAEQYGLAQGLLAKIAYRDALEPNIADLLYEKAECERLAETEGKLGDAQEQLPLLVNAGNYAEARELYDKVLLLTRGKAEARQVLDAVFAPVRGLEALSQMRQRPDTPPEELVKQAQDLIARFPDHVAVQQAVEQVVLDFLPELERRARDVRRSEIGDALTFGQGLQDLTTFTDISKEIVDRCQQAVEDLENKRKVREQARNLYDEAQSRDDAESMNQALRQASQANVELYDDVQSSVDQLIQASTQGARIDRLGRIAQKYRDRRDEYLNLKADWEKTRAEIRRLIDQFEQDKQTIEAIKAMDVYAERQKLGEKLDTLREEIDRAKMYLDIVNQLRDTDELLTQIKKSWGIMIEGTIQYYIDKSTIALRSFDLGGSRVWVKRLTEYLGGLEESKSWEKLPGSRGAAPYKNLAEFLSAEYNLLNNLNDQDQETLNGIRMVLDNANELNKRQRQSLMKIRAKVPASVFVDELWRVAQPEDERIGRFSSNDYDREQMEMHKTLLRLLMDRNIEKLSEEAIDFTNKWRKKFDKKKNDLAKIRHDEFVNVWLGRITQAQAINGRLEAIEHFLSNPQGTNTQSVDIARRLHDRMENIIIYTSPEIFSVFSEKYGRCMRHLVAAIRVRKINIDENRINNIFRDTKLGNLYIWKLIDTHTARGKLFFDLVLDKHGTFEGDK